MSQLFKLTLTAALILLFNSLITGSDEKSKKMTDLKTDDHKYTNALINENSPYLLSHAHNPVNWYTWSKEALAKAKSEDKPIFLSIGYSACHWCHVMERESFENEELAELLNNNFISIKVDREQRPDLDQIYMTFTTAITGQGGWPMSVFLTPDLKPFFAGTYFPPDDHYGRPGFKRILVEIARSYKEDKEAIINSSNDILKTVKERLYLDIGNDTSLSKDKIALGARALMKNFDRINGGFGIAPKFPHPTELSYFLRFFRRSGEFGYLEATNKALSSMANGGIYDHLGGGFARYSTDEKWLVPHFEKMLYDNALLIETYSDAYNITGNEHYRQIVEETLDFIISEMADNNGGFYSALDADSEGEEGKFYVWSKNEIEKILDDNTSDIFCKFYNITDKGNFEEKNILNLIEQSDKIKNEMSDEEFEKNIIENKKRLLEARSKRIRPLTDDKILSSWNGMALSAFCAGYRTTSNDKYLETAVDNALFVSENLWRDGKLIHSYCKGSYSSGEFLEDYAFYTKGLLDLYETDTKNNDRWLEFAVILTDRATELFLDSSGHFFLREDNLSDLIIRPSNEIDNAIPSPGSIMIGNLIKISRLTDDNRYLEIAERCLKALTAKMDNYQGGMTSALASLDYYMNDKIEIVIIGSDKISRDMLKTAYKQFIPNRIIAYSKEGNSNLPLFEGRKNKNNKSIAYVCLNSVCNLPVYSADELKNQLARIK